EINDAVEQQLENSRFLDQGSHFLEQENLLTFTETDFSLEYAENALLQEAQVLSTSQSIQATLGTLIDDRINIEQMTQYLERVQFKAGDYIYRYADPEQDLFLIERGKVSLLVPKTLGGELRLRKLGPGTLLGENDFYDGTPRDTDAVVTEDCVLWRLKASTLRSLMREQPQIAGIFHEFMARSMSYRVGQLSSELQTI
ncbi:MAG: cyclic nucleotide-binding domain-containing protein, partial [Cyanobacteria bacterium P01_H01_bin.121]